MRLLEVIKKDYELYHHRFVVMFFTQGPWGKRLPDKTFLKCRYYAIFGRKLNLKNPQTYNEKLQWLKLYDRNPQYIQLVDKYDVKAYIENKIGEEYIIPTLGVWDNFDDIVFEKLPNQFVLKTTHDSGGVVICNDKSNFNIEKAKEKIEKSLANNFFYTAREWPYKNVKGRIIAEAYLEADDGEDLNDYKIMCFNGKAKCSFVCSERFSNNGLKVTFFDREWNKMPFERHYPSSDKLIEKPVNYEKMIELAEVLSENIPFVRVDFYEVKGQLYFGELTFYPGAGWEEFEPEEWDRKLGEWITLPKEV